MAHPSINQLQTPLQSRLFILNVMKLKLRLCASMLPKFLCNLRCDRIVQCTNAGKYPAAPAAHTCTARKFQLNIFAGNFPHIFQEIFVIFEHRSLSKLSGAKTEVYHHHEQNRTSFKTIHSMQEVLLMTCTCRKFLFFDLAARKRNIFPGLDRAVIYTNFIQIRCVLLATAKSRLNPYFWRTNLVFHKPCPEKTLDRSPASNVRLKHVYTRRLASAFFGEETILGTH